MRGNGIKLAKGARALQDSATGERCWYRFHVEMEYPEGQSRSIFVETEAGDFIAAGEQIQCMFEGAQARIKGDITLVWRGYRQDPFADMCNECREKLTEG